MAGAAAGRGLLSVARLVAARPVLVGGLASFGVMTAMVANNALFSQAGQHPHPMLATRLATPVAAAALSSEPVPQVTARPAPIGNDPRILPFPLVQEAQMLLAEQGYYKAAIDGRAGQATDIAIRAFQTDQGLRVDGMATPLLLTQIRQAAVRARAGETQTASLEETVDTGQTGGIVPASAPTTDTDLVHAIQAKLAEAKVADIKADGILGERTRAAIRTFQALEGMDVDGSPSMALLERLNGIDGSQ